MTIGADGAGARADALAERSQVVRFQDVHDKAAAYMSPRDLVQMQRAYVLCARAHDGQSRLSGEPYLVHPLAVADILAGLHMDPVTVVAGLLHDILEDTSTSLEEITRLFGSDVAHVVDGVTKLSKLAFSTKEEAQAESFRKMILAMADDLRVILVKLADRLHNMRTLGYLPRDKQIAVAQETAEIFVPIAQRLGMGRMKAELEDLAFRHREPVLHAALTRQLEQLRQADESLIRDLESRLVACLDGAGIAARIQGRRKSLASLHKKLLARGIGVEEVHDTVAFRVLTGSVADCYAALGVIHAAWTPIQQRFKDYVATPKPNGYRSLHTTLLASNGTAFEVQIRTEEMHLVAEDGVAAHWGYKAGSAPTHAEAARFAWLRNLLDAQADHSDPREFMAAVKMDLYGDEVYCFTPKGDVKVLPAGSTPLDFAYAIHSEIGQHCVGARIDGVLVPLRSRLAHGNRIEILTSPSQTPSRDWLQFVATSRARAKIRQWLNLHSREAVSEEVRAPASRSTPALVGPDLAPGRRPPHPAPRQQRRAGRGAKTSPVLAAGASDLLMYLGRCCHPVKGEPILGHVTRGKGVSVHRSSCRNAASLQADSPRLIAVDWNPESTARFDVRLKVSVADRSGMLGDVTGVVAEQAADIKSATARALPARRGIILLTVEVEDSRHLTRVMRAISKVDGVRGVERA